MLAALVIQHAKRMRYIILSPVACPALPICTTLSDKRHGFRKISSWTFSLQLLSETFVILGRIQQDSTIYVDTSSCKVPCYAHGNICKLCGWFGNSWRVGWSWPRSCHPLVFSRQSFEGVVEFHMCSRNRLVSCGQTDVTKLTVAFRERA